MDPMSGNFARLRTGGPMKKIILILCLVPLLQGSPSGDTPADAAHQFYATVLAIHAKDCLPDTKELHRLAPFMSRRLTALLRHAWIYREQFIKNHPPQRTQEGYLIHDKPPLIDGDCFSSNLEGVTRFTLGQLQESGGRYRIALNLVYVDATRPGKPASWTDAIIIIKENGRFVVDDMEFLGDWPYANHGLLSRSLEDAKNSGK